MPRVLKNYDDHEQPSPRIYPQTSRSSNVNPAATAPGVLPTAAAPLASEEQLSPTRAVGSPSRPSQPPPAPPPEQALSPSRGSRSGSNQRDSLPPPPPPPPTSESESNLMQLMQNGHGHAGVHSSGGAVTNGVSHHPVQISVGVSGPGDDMLPPPPPNPENAMLAARVPVEHLPPSPPPFPTMQQSTATVTTTSTATPATSSAIPPAAPPPPPPPPPSDQMNGLRITNGDVAKNLKVGIDFELDIPT